MCIQNLSQLIHTIAISIRMKIIQSFLKKLVEGRQILNASFVLDLQIFYNKKMTPQEFRCNSNDNIGIEFKP